MSLHYSRHGSGTPVVLLHGYLSSGRYWRHVVPLLLSSHEVITIDLLGFGDSPKPRRASYSRHNHADAVIETIEEAIGSASFELVGHSMGALIANEIALQHPDRVTKLVLFNPPIVTSRDEVRDMLKGTSRFYQTMLYSPLGRIGWPVMKRLIKSPLVHTTPKMLKPIAASSGRNTHTSRRRSLKHTIEQTNTIDLLQNTAVPTTVVSGLRDRPIYRQNAESHAAGLPRNISMIWLDEGHHIPAKQPDVVTAYI